MALPDFSTIDYRTKKLLVKYMMLAAVVFAGLFILIMFKPLRTLWGAL